MNWGTHLDNRAILVNLLLVGFGHDRDDLFNFVFLGLGGHDSSMDLNPYGRQNAINQDRIVPICFQGLCGGLLKANLVQRTPQGHKEQLDDLFAKTNGQIERTNN